jgi:hypothetical protein
MTFAKGDVNINRSGRPPVNRDIILTNRQVKDRELLTLLRKIKPHLTESIMVAAKIMKNEEAAHQNQLKACVILLNAYKETLQDLYDQEDDGEALEVQPAGAKVSFFYKPEAIDGGKDVE